MLEGEDSIVYDVKRGCSAKQMRLNHRDMSLYGAEPDNDVFSVVACHHCGMIVKTQVFAAHVKHRHNFGPMSDIALMPVDLLRDERETLHEASIKQTRKRKRTETDNGDLSHSKQIKTQNMKVSHIPAEDHSQSQSLFKQQPKPETNSTMMRTPKAKLLESNQQNVISPSGFMRPRPVGELRRHPSAQKKMTNRSFISPYQTQIHQSIIASQKVEASHSFPTQPIKTENPLPIMMKLKKSDVGSWKVVAV